MRLPKSANTFAKALAAYRDHHGLTGQKLAERLDLRHQRVYTWLLGQNLPPRRQAQEIADRLEMPGLVAVIDRERVRRRRAKRRTAKRRTAGAA